MGLLAATHCLPVRLCEECNRKASPGLSALPCMLWCRNASIRGTPGRVYKALGAFMRQRIAGRQSDMALLMLPVRLTWQRHSIGKAFQDTPPKLQPETPPAKLFIHAQCTGQLQGVPKHISRLQAKLQFSPLQAACAPAQPMQSCQVSPCAQTLNSVGLRSRR